MLNEKRFSNIHQQTNVVTQFAQIYQSEIVNSLVPNNSNRIQRVCIPNKDGIINFIIMN